MQAAEWIDLSGKVAHVTGAGKGIGAGIAFKDFQIDLGADFSNYANGFALSAIYSF